MASPTLDEPTRQKLATALRARRDGFLREALGAEAEIAELDEQATESELEERSQQDRSLRLLDRLDERGRRGVEAVTMALDRLAEGTYGLCVDCGEPIPPARLEALPETERCVPCAEAFEGDQPRARVGGHSLAPARADVAVLDDDEFEGLMWETLRSDERLDLDELEIECRRGMVRLAGALPSQAELEIVQKTLTDLAGATNVIAQVRVEPMAWQRSDRTPGLESEPPSDYDAAEGSAVPEEDDAFESDGYDAPERPPLDEEPE